MAKRILKLSTFHGGLNNNSDERDLDDNQVSEVVGLELSNIGKLQPNYHPKKDQTLSDSMNGIVVNDSIVPGSKFFSFVTDKPLIHINQLYFFGTITSVSILLVSAFSQPPKSMRYCQVLEPAHLGKKIHTSFLSWLTKLPRIYLTSFVAIWYMHHMQ